MALLLPRFVGISLLCPNGVMSGAVVGSPVYGSMGSWSKHRIISPQVVNGFEFLS